MAGKPIPVKGRILKKIRIDGECWIWTASTKGSRPYGKIGVGKKQLRAHRVSYEVFVGEIPAGLHVLHKCDRTLCVNPDHLFIGTHADNMRDMASKGRQKPPSHFPRPQRGEQQHSAKLTSQQALSIREDARPNVQIAKELGVTGSLIGMVKSRKIWRHL